MRLVLMADTHIPRRARDLPEQLWRAVEAADVVVHAGDWVCVELLDALLARSRQLIGVVGNNDGPSLRARLPEVATVELGGVRLAVVHETGLRLLNPGSPTDRRRQPTCSWMTAEINDGRLDRVQLHRTAG
jgi:putative phosphoesterase